MVANALLSATPKKTNEPAAISVICGLVRSSKTRAIAEVTRPPAKSTKPVPKRLRTPSTSLMMRETKAPVLLVS